MKKNLHIWWLYALTSFQGVLINKPLIGVFILAKLLRIGLFFVFLIFLFHGSSGLAGYSRNQIIFFYLAFNLIDTLAQFFFRAVYSFRPLLVNGYFDFLLIQPASPLLFVLLGGPDLMDLIMLFLISGFTLWWGIAFIQPSLWQWLLFLLMVINGLVVAAGFHIFVLGLGVITLSVDHLIMIYRDFTSMLRIPVDLYVEPIRFLITFIIPLGVMITFPAKALLGLLGWQLIIFSFAFSIIGLYLSLRFWRFSLRFYQSASS
jgi:ABC-2 type transport system permease protein